MKDRITFFLMGALLATIAYVAGDMHGISAGDNGIQGKEIDELTGDPDSPVSVIHFGDKSNQGSLSSDSPVE